MMVLMHCTGCKDLTPEISLTLCRDCTRMYAASLARAVRYHTAFTVAPASVLSALAAPIPNSQHCEGPLAVVPYASWVICPGHGYSPLCTKA